MNGKKAKALRKLSNHIARDSKPLKAYETITHSKGSKQVKLVKDCTRYNYQILKKAVRDLQKTEFNWPSFAKNICN